ncbi:hypothetical protein [Lignipirellula cremea]|uniref:hypothetical protein n=1 Tax=Lignipirellula cremea TaxID=2528010 RepID=UPI0011A4BE2F|nr:hypothetical protein [Lignipirellula cremea]
MSSFDVFVVTVAAGLLVVICVAPILVFISMFSPNNEKPPGPGDHRTAPCPACQNLAGIDEAYCPHCGARLE